MPIKQHQWDLEFAVRQIQIPLCLISYNMQSHETSVDVQPGNSHGVVVIPQQSRVLLVRIIVGARLARDIPFFGISIAFRRRLAAMQMDYASNLRDVSTGTMHRIVNREK